MLKRLKIALLALTCLVPLSAIAMVQQHPLQSPATSLASAYATAESISPNTPSYPHETLVIIEYSDGSVLSYRCRNNPVEGFDALGLDYIKKDFIYESTLSGRRWTGRYKVYWVVQDTIWDWIVDGGRKFILGEAEHELGIGPQTVNLLGGGSLSYSALEDAAQGKERGRTMVVGQLKDASDAEARAWVDKRAEDMQNPSWPPPMVRRTLDDPNLITILNGGLPHDPNSPLARVEAVNAEVTGEFLRDAVLMRVVHRWRPPAPEPLDWSIVSKAGETRSAHVIAQHGAIDLQKPIQGVFYGEPTAAINDAWTIAQRQGIRPITSGGVDLYVVPRANSGFAGGYSGQLQNLDTVTIITQKGTSKIITGYPGN